LTCRCWAALARRRAAPVCQVAIAPLHLGMGVSASTRIERGLLTVFTAGMCCSAGGGVRNCSSFPGGALEVVVVRRGERRGVVHSIGSTTHTRRTVQCAYIRVDDGKCTAGCGECSTPLLCSRCQATYSLHVLPASPLSPFNVSVCLPALSPTALLQLLGRSSGLAATEEVDSEASADWRAPLRLALSAMSGAASPSRAQAPFAQVQRLQPT
jgi:hypothetical protein